MKKKNRYIRLLPFICATLLLLGSCMTVCASTFKFPTEYQNGNYVVIQQNGKYFFCETDGIIYRDLNGYLMCKVSDATYTYSYVSDNMTDWKLNNQTFGRCFSTSQYTIIKSNVNIYTAVDINDTLVKDDEHLFFPQPLARLAIPLTAEIQKQTGIILPIAVCCLALLIGSIVLLPRLRLFLLR